MAFRVFPIPSEFFFCHINVQPELNKLFKLDQTKKVVVELFIHFFTFNFTLFLPLFRRPSNSNQLHILASSITVEMPSHSPAIRPHSLLSFLLFALLGHYQYPSSNSNNFGPSNSAMALPTSMLNWNTLANNFYPFGQLFRRNNNNNNSPIREEPANSAAMIALVVVKSGPKRNEKTSSEIGQPSLLSTVEEKMPSEIAASLPHSPNRMTAKLPNQQQKFGTLKLCPPGGRSFFEAFELACPMKKRRKRHVMFGGLANRIRAEPLPRYNRRGGGGDLEEENEDNIQNGEGHHLKEEETKSREYRPANISEIMRICCVSGCEFADFFPHCGPFSMW